MRRWSIARRLAVAQLAGLLVLSVLATGVSYLQTRQTVYALEREHVVAGARLIADEDRIRAAFVAEDPSAALQPLTLELPVQADVDWVTFFGTDATRVAHRDPALEGTRFPGDLTEVLSGRVSVDTVATGPAGLSLRALAPVLSPEEDGRVVGVVGVGRRVPELDIAVAAQVPRILLLTGLLAALALLGAALLGRYISRTTHGLGPEELAARFAVLDTALHNVSEGMVLLSPTGHLVLYNDRAAELLGLPPGGEAGAAPERPPHVAALGLPGPLTALLRSGRRARDELYAVGERILVVNQRPARPGTTRPGRRRILRRAPGPETGQATRETEGSTGNTGSTGNGTVVTLYDRTEVQQMNRELESTRSLTDALRAQTHEHANRLHTLYSLLELGRPEQARELLAASLDAAGTGAGTAAAAEAEPALEALLLAKAAQARERGVAMAHRNEVDAPTGIPAPDLVTLLGNLLDNALDAAADPALDPADRWVDAEARLEDGWLVLQVADGGPGPSREDRERIFELGWSTKPAGPAGRGVGLALVRQTARRLGGTWNWSRTRGPCSPSNCPCAPARRPAGRGATVREYRVLVIEDEQVTAETYGEYLARTGGFEVVHVSPTARDALGFLAEGLRRTGSFGVDMVLLDMNLPDGHGLDVLRQMRAAGFTGGVLALTASTELATIRRAVALGVVQYLVKPFGYAQFAERVRAFRELAAEFAGAGSAPGQDVVDRAFPRSRPTGPPELPKGLTEGTLDAVVDLLRRTAHGAGPGAGADGAPGPVGPALSAGEVGAAVGTSRVTARRYLEHLYRVGMVERSPRYGTPGRPENEYRWTGGAGA
ncbi:response regulator [Citricoccus sp. SGAir0253]|uniref:response regulator n=1 Tax=Citricoccus sp. SGAir0253 TaxID=2567881 RepID=UPI00143DEBB9